MKHANVALVSIGVVAVIAVVVGLALLESWVPGTTTMLAVLRDVIISPSLAIVVIIVVLRTPLERVLEGLAERVRTGQWSLGFQGARVESQPSRGDAATPGTTSAEVPSQPQPPRRDAATPDATSAEGDGHADSTRQEAQQERIRQENVVGELDQYKLALWAERTYRLIFGSQIQALKTLNIYTNGLSTAALRSIHDQYHTKQGGAVPFELWNSFLLNTTLEVSEPPPSDTHKITDYGTWFLTYLANNHMPEWKPF